MKVILTRRSARVVWIFLVGATLSEGVVLAYVYQPSGPWLSSLIRYTWNPAGNAPAWTLAAAVAAAYIAYAMRRSPIIRGHAFHPASWRPYLDIRLVALVMAVVTGLFEELMFRRIIMDNMMHAGYSTGFQILVSALSFGVVHAIWGLFEGQVAAALSAMLATSILGLLLAWVYVVGDRSLAPPAAAHILVSLVLEPWLILTSATASWGRRG